MRKVFLFLFTIGVALRIAAATLRLDFIFPDEHFQVLEPAYWVVHGFGEKSWEWYYGTRTWVVPGFYIPLVWLAKITGLNGGATLIILCRVFTTLLSCFAIWRFNRVLELARFHKLARLISFAMLVFSSAMVVWNSSTLSDAWAFIFLWCAMPSILGFIANKEPPHRNKQLFLSGILLGCSFMIRIQMVFWAIGFIVAILTIKNLRGNFYKIFTWLCLGYSIPVLFQGTLDWITWGYPFQSTIKNFQFNILQGVAAANGKEPWYMYFEKVWNNLGPGIIWLLIFSAALAFIKNVLTKNSKKIRFTEVDFLIFIPAAFFFIAHVFIGHKETRFILPALPVVFYAIAFFLDKLFADQKQPSVNEWKKHMASFIGIGIIIACAMLTWSSVKNDEHYFAGDLVDLQKITSEDLHFKNAKDCLLLIDRYTFWTHGHMLQGVPIRFIETKSEELSAQNLPDCRYAILAENFADRFESLSAGIWTKVQNDRRGNVLYKR